MTQRYMIVLDTGVPLDAPDQSVIYRASRPDVSDLTALSFEAQAQPVKGADLVAVIWKLFQSLWTSNARVIVAEMPVGDVPVSVPIQLVEKYVSS